MARQILSFIAAQIADGGSFGSFCPAVYDTAWVAMVEKQIDGKSTYLFPECFEFIKSTQAEDGSWGKGTSDVDGIMNTLAALLAMSRRIPSDPGIDLRCKRAIAVLKRMLNTWDIDRSDRVGFEILVPNLLRLLEKEGVYFDFPVRASLMSLGEAKLAKLRLVLAGPDQTTLIHSLEAFVGELDFDQVKHHRASDGSMLGSPSSTAAYLMNSSSWDEDAEGYLRRVFEARPSGEFRGGFPSAFPTSIFEVAWVTSTLLEAGFTSLDFDPKDIETIKQFLAINLEKQGGVVGFAPSYLSDADDTAKTLSTLILLGECPTIEPMLAEFEADSYFLTFHGERNPSISANINIFRCLLESPQRFKHTKQIIKCAMYLTESWLAGDFHDKWNISSYYPMMLLSQALVLFLGVWESKGIERECIPETLLQKLIPLTLFEIFHRTIELQKSDGSWDSKHEVTAYAILTITPLLNVPWLESCRAEGKSCMERGNAYLHQNRDDWVRGDLLWIEKVSYSSSNLSQAYCLAASKASVDTYTGCTEMTNNLCYQPKVIIAKFSQFFSRISFFAEISSWKLDFSLLQSFQFVPLLKRLESVRFPKAQKTSRETYLQYIPFTWIGCKNKLSTEISTDILWEMMLISMLNFQVDAYMENVLEKEYENNFEALKATVQRLCATIGREKDTRSHRVNGHSANGTSFESGHADKTLNDQCKAATENVIEGFITHILCHPKVVQSDLGLQSWLRHELQTFLLAHITHMEDCVGLSTHVDTKSTPRILGSPRCTYFNWVRSTGADHTSCPYSFVFYLCLVTKPKSGWVDNFQQRYMLEDACRHLAAMCRQYNDFGSVTRDREEENLNSINFPEFEKMAKQQDFLSFEEIEQARKDELLRVAGYERRCLEAILLELEQCLEPDLVSKLKLFVSVTDLYGQIYMARDIGIRKV